LGKKVGMSLIKRSTMNQKAGNKNGKGENRKLVLIRELMAVADQGAELSQRKKGNQSERAFLPPNPTQ